MRMRKREGSSSFSQLPHSSICFGLVTLTGWERGTIADNIPIACLTLLLCFTMKTKEELLDQLHRLTAEELINRIIEGEASAAELGVAVRFLKDNNIDVSEQSASPIHDLAAVVPFSIEDQKVASGD